MTEKLYHVNEIFYSLQGEGRWAGSPAIFIRFSGCNLRCPFCDTNFSAHKGMTVGEILDAMRQWEECSFVVLTGGEPTLQVTTEFVMKLQQAGFRVAMETNGTRAYPSNLDWVTVSPKTDYVANGEVAVRKADEVKVVYDGKHEPSTFGISAEAYYVQPCDVGDKRRNKEIVDECIDWIKKHPLWKLSLQQQKIINVR